MSKHTLAAPAAATSKLTVLDGYDPPIVGYELPNGDFHVAEIIAQPNDDDTDRYARLFAAAPDMLSFLRAMLEYLEGGEISVTSRDIDEEAMLVELRAAIARAEGGGA